MIFVFQVPKISLCVCAKPLQLCPTLCNPMDYSPPGSSVHGILQARILEWVAISFSRGSSWPRNWTHVSCLLHWQVGSLLLAPPGMLKSTHESFKILFFPQSISSPTSSVNSTLQLFISKQLHEPPNCSNYLLSCPFTFQGWDGCGRRGSSRGGGCLCCPCLSQSSSGFLLLSQRFTICLISSSGLKLLKG